MGVTLIIYISKFHAQVRVPTFRIKDPEEHKRQPSPHCRHVKTKHTYLYRRAQDTLFHAAGVQQIVSFVQVLVPTFRVKHPEEQKKARQELAHDTIYQAVNTCVTCYFAGAGAHLPHQAPRGAEAADVAPIADSQMPILFSKDGT
jgi:hypothetical protein